MLIGDLCAVSSALLWSGSVILMRISGRQLAPLPLTFFKIWIAVGCFLLVLLWEGGPWMPDLPGRDYLRLVVSESRQ